MSLPLMLASLAGSGGGAKVYVDDVFSTYLYTGNGSTQTINNGIDLAGNGGLVWTKGRSGSARNHCLNDSARGIANGLNSNTTSAQSARNITSFNSNGYTTNPDFEYNASGETFVSWTFRKAPKFFDVVTYTGDGAVGRQIPHSLGIAPGMIIVKSYSGAFASGKDWVVYHRSNGASNRLYLNLTDASSASPTTWNNTEPTSTVFSIGDNGFINQAGHQYVTYLFAHDPSAEGIIQCGSFTTDASGNATVNLGWEPQYLMVKASSKAESWFVSDSMRGLTASNSGAILFPNLTNTEANSTLVRVNATGFSVVGADGQLSFSTSYIYLAIRRPNKPPTTGTQVYNAVARTGTGAAATVTGVGFAPDMVLANPRDQGSGKHLFDRLRGKNNFLVPDGTNAENTSYSNTLTSFDMDGFSVGADSTSTINWSGHTIINWCFRRAPGFFDVVCYTGTGVARTVNHNLGVVPELMIVKSRTESGSFWCVYHKDLLPTKYIPINTNDAAVTTSVIWGDTAPTMTVFTVDTSISVNKSAATYASYLFSSLQGVSKVGSYTGNGSSQTINCGFSTGARFLLIKRTDSAGDWLVWDTARGIVAANDPHLSLNTTAAEITTDDSVDPDASGFIVNQNTATNINVTGTSYIFLAIS